MRRRITDAGPAIGGCGLALLASLLATGASALEQPPAFTDEDLRIGVDMTPIESVEAKDFCQSTMGRSAVTPAEMDRICDCFPRAWQERTNRLHRLVLPITVSPDTPESRRNLALIMRQQGGIHEDRLKQLSVEYELAARQAFKACR